MITDIDKYVEFLCDNDITANEFLILWLVHTKDTESIKKYKQAKGAFAVVDIEHLISLNFITNFSMDGSYDIFSMMVTDKFTKRVVIDEDDAYEELQTVYPAWIEVKGTKYPTIKGDPMVVAKDYFKAHKGNRLAHKRIMDITRMYYANRPVTGNIHDYILNRRWNLLEKELGLGNNRVDAFQVI